MKRQPGACRAALTLAALAILGGCSNGSIPAAAPSVAGPASASRTAAPSAKRGKTKVEMLVRIPRAPRHVRGRRLRPYFVASTTQGIQVTVYAHGSKSILATTAVNVGPSSELCQTSGGVRSCTVAAEAPVGDDDFVVTSFDAPPSGGSFAGAKQLGYGATTFAVVKGASNAIGLTLGGVVAKGAVVLGTSSVPVIDNDSQTVTVSALDADGNTIVSDGWYDANGDAVTIALTSSNVSPVTLGFAPANVSFSAPSSTLTYTSSTASPAQIQSGFSATISATPSTAGSVAGNAALSFAKPAITEVSVTTSNSQPSGITVGPDNALWFTECASNKIGRLTTTGTSVSEFSTNITANAAPKGIAAGPDGKLWFAESGIGKVASIDPTSDTIVEHVTPSGSTDSPTGIIEGPDGNMWFTESSSTYSQIATFDASALDQGLGLIAEYAAHTAGSAPNAIAAGPDGKIWFTEGTIDQIGRITTSGTGATDFPLTDNSLGQGGITAGPDGAMWFAEQNPNMGNKIGRMTTAGSVSSQTTVNTNSFSNPTGIVTGPDGALWFTENCNNAIGRIDPATKTIVEFSLPHTTSYPYGIVKGPDGALWFTEGLGNRIGKLQ